MTSWNIYLNSGWFRYFRLQTLFLLNKKVIEIQIKQHIWYAAVSTFHLRPFSFQSEDVNFLDHWSVKLTIHCYDVISEPISNFIFIVMWTKAAFRRYQIYVSRTYTFQDRGGDLEIPPRSRIVILQSRSRIGLRVN